MSNLEFIESATESLLGVLRRRDDEALHKLTATIATLSREKNRELSAAEDRELLSYQLGAIETLESLAVRAAARAPMNARFEVMRRRHALGVLQFLARTLEHTGTPTQLAEALKQQRSNISRLIDAMIRVGVVKRAGTLPDRTFGDARISPVQITQAGMEMLEGMKPNWRTEAASLKSLAAKPHRLNMHVVHLGPRTYMHYFKDADPANVKVRQRKTGRVLHAIELGVAHIINVRGSDKPAHYDIKRSRLTASFEPAPGSVAFVTTKSTQ